MIHCFMMRVSSKIKSLASAVKILIGQFLFVVVLLLATWVISTFRLKRKAQRNCRGSSQRV